MPALSAGAGDEAEARAYATQAAEVAAKAGLESAARNNGESPRSSAPCARRPSSNWRRDLTATADMLQVTRETFLKKRVMQVAGRQRRHGSRRQVRTRRPPDPRGPPRAPPMGDARGRRQHPAVHQRLHRAASFDLHRPGPLVGRRRGPGRHRMHRRRDQASHGPSTSPTPTRPKTHVKAVPCPHCRRTPAQDGAWPVTPYPSTYLERWTNTSGGGSLREGPRTIRSCR